MEGIKFLRYLIFLRACLLFSNGFSTIAMADMENQTMIGLAKKLAFDRQKGNCLAWLVMGKVPVMSPHLCLLWRSAFQTKTIFKPQMWDARKADKCHVNTAGLKVRIYVLVPALDQTTHWPAYRSTWGGMSSLHRRYTSCSKGVCTKFFAQQSKEYRWFRRQQISLHGIQECTA